MPARTELAVPTTLPLPDHLRVTPSSSDAVKTLSKLSRPSLISLALQWLEDAHRKSCTPYTLSSGPESPDTDQAIYDAAQDIEELTEIYHNLQSRKGSKKEIVDRILEGDWRHGLSLYQLATAETRYLLEHQNSQRWCALQLAPATPEDSKGPADKHQMPRFHATTFLRNLKRELAPAVKAHYYMTREERLRCTFVRVQVYELPYNTQRALRESAALEHATIPSEGSKAVFIAFPDSTPYVYFSVSSAGAMSDDGVARSVRQIVMAAIPQALSRPQARYVLQPTRLVSRSLPTLLALRGSNRTNNASGGWSIFVDARTDSEQADDPEKQQAQATGEADKENVHAGRKRHFNTQHEPSPHEAKRLKSIASGRFGTSARTVTDQPLERFDVKLTDGFPSGLEHLQQEDDGDDTTLPDLETWKPELRLSFQGVSVFHGLRKLVEAGVIDGRKMPGWMTGQEGVSWGVVRDGRMAGKDEI